MADREPQQQDYGSTEPVPEPAAGPSAADEPVTDMSTDTQECDDPPVQVQVLSSAREHWLSSRTGLDSAPGTVYVIYQAYAGSTRRINAPMVRLVESLPNTEAGRRLAQRLRQAAFTGHRLRLSKNSRGESEWVFNGRIPVSDHQTHGLSEQHLQRVSAALEQFGI